MESRASAPQAGCVRQEGKQQVFGSYVIRVEGAGFTLCAFDHLFRSGSHIINPSWLEGRTRSTPVPTVKG